MPLVAHSHLPTFERLRQEGQTVLSPERAQDQYIRELHVGLLNMMPDAALAATERQFFRLVGQSNSIAQFYVHPFSLDGLERGPKGREHIERYYDRFEDLQRDGLDALIITGANVTHGRLPEEPFWEPLGEVVRWAWEHVTSTLCSCLATHAVMEQFYGQPRRRMARKRWGVFHHRVMDRTHPLVSGVNTRFDVPHSRWNDISLEQFEMADLRVLVESPQAGVHLATSHDGLRQVFFQGHPEYDTISLLKEYKRDLLLYAAHRHPEPPPFPENYLGAREQALLDEYRERLERARDHGLPLPEFPEALIAPYLDNTWHDSAEAVVGNWMGLVYQLTHRDRHLPFMEGVDPDDPLQILRH